MHVHDVHCHAARFRGPVPDSVGMVALKHTAQPKRRWSCTRCMRSVEEQYCRCRRVSALGDSRVGDATCRRLCATPLPCEPQYQMVNRVGCLDSHSTKSVGREPRSITAGRDLREHYPSGSDRR